MKLFDYIGPILPRPLSDLGVQACNAYEGLPGELEWRPKTPHEVSSRVLSYGVPLAIIGHNQSFYRLLKPFVPEILRNGKMPQHAWSVMHAGAILRLLRGEVEFVKETLHPTPDIRTTWASEMADCEVTSPLVKEQQKELDAILSNLRNSIGLQGRDWHLLIHLADLPKYDDQNRIIDAVLDLTAGQRFDIEGVLQVYAVPLDEGEALAGGPELEKLRPVWWKGDGPTLNSSALSICDVPANTRRLRVSAMMPFVTYFNSIEAKVWSGQRDKDNPYVIVVDQSSMPLRHKILYDQLSERFIEWDHVSAIVLFDWRPYYLRSYCWKLSVHINPRAILAAPAPLLGLDPQDKEICVEVYD